MSFENNIGGRREREVRDWERHVTWVVNIAQGVGGPLNYPVKWELSRQIIQIAQAEASPSGVCARAQPQSCLLESQGFVLPWVKPHLCWLPTINNEWLTIRSSGLKEFIFSLMSSVVMDRWTWVQLPAVLQHATNCFAQVQRVMVTLASPSTPSPAAPLQILWRHKPQNWKSEGVHPIPAPQRACQGSGGGHLACRLPSSSSMRWRGWTRTLHFFFWIEVI